MKIKRPIYLDTVNLISIILLPLTFFTFLFNYLKKLSPKVKFKVKTICVGNIYLGGTGKTPLVIKINSILKKKYKKGRRISSETNQNKKEKYVNITIDPVDKNLIVDGSSFKGKVDNDIIIGTWWNHEIVKAKAQISAISGRIIGQKVTFLGKKQITIGGKEYNSLHFNFKSSDETLPDNKKLNTDIWYEEKTFLWLKASFDKRGYWEYRLKEVR